MTTLLIESGPLAGRRITVSSELVIGRADADLTIDDPEISRHHAAVRPVEGGVEVEDLGSTNGTWMNDQRIDGRRRVVPGDAFRIGGTALRLEGDPAPAAGRVVAPIPARAADAPAAVAPAAPVFGAPARTGARRAATRSYFATGLAVVVILADAVALVLYFALR